MASTTVSETHDWLSEDARKRVQRRHAADRRMRLYWLAAIGLAIGLLAILIGPLVLSGYTAFVQTKVALTGYVDPAQVAAADIGGGHYHKLARHTQDGQATCRERVCQYRLNTVVAGTF